MPSSRDPLPAAAARRCGGPRCGLHGDALGLSPWDDPHNADPAYARARVRHPRRLPALETALGPGVGAGRRPHGRPAADRREALDELATGQVPLCARPGRRLAGRRARRPRPPRSGPACLRMRDRAGTPGSSPRPARATRRPLPGTGSAGPTRRPGEPRPRSPDVPGPGRQELLDHPGVPRNRLDRPRSHVGRRLVPGGPQDPCRVTSARAWWGGERRRPVLIAMPPQQAGPDRGGRGRERGGQPPPSGSPQQPAPGRSPGSSSASASVRSWRPCRASACATPGPSAVSRAGAPGAGPGPGHRRGRRCAVVPGRQAERVHMQPAAWPAARPRQRPRGSGRGSGNPGQRPGAERGQAEQDRSAGRQAVASRWRGAGYAGPPRPAPGSGRAAAAGAPGRPRPGPATTVTGTASTGSRPNAGQDGRRRGGLVG